MAELWLRNDVYRRPLATALERLGLGPGWRCVDVGAGAGDVSVGLALLVGETGRVYAVDSDPLARDEVATAAAAVADAQVIAITQAGEDLRLPEPVDLAFCRFLLLHVFDPAVVLRRMTAAVRDGGYVVAQEPITSAGRIGELPFQMPGARRPDIGALLPELVVESGCELVDAWAEAPAGYGPGPVSDYVAELTGVECPNDPIILPPLVTVIGRRPGPMPDNVADERGRPDQRRGPGQRRRAVFVDRDGVINRLAPDPETDLPESPVRIDDVELLPEVPEALRELRRAGFALICVTNQPAAAKGKVDLATLKAIQERVLGLLEGAGAALDAAEVCFHHPDGVVAELSGSCDCRKPSPGMLKHAARELGIDLGDSWIVGDSESDIEAGHAVGVRAVLVEHPESRHRRVDATAADVVLADLPEAARYIVSKESGW